MVEISISNSTQDFFGLSSDDIIFLVSDYFNVPENEIVNKLEEIENKTGYSISWLVEYIIIKTHYKDLLKVFKLKGV